VGKKAIEIGRSQVVWNSATAAPIRSDGLGVELDFQIVELYRQNNPLHIPKGVYSDMMSGEDYFPECLP